MKDTSIPHHIMMKKTTLPDAPGVYFFYDTRGTLLYIGKATSLRKRVCSYFVVKKHDRRLSQLVSRIGRIDFMETPTVLEALVLEANQIKQHQPSYNVLQKDDKSFLYLAITREDFPRPLLLRAHEMEAMGVNPFDRELSEKARKKFLSVFGPYTSGTSLKRALELLRRSIPWSTCSPPSVSGRTRPCFDVHLRRCPGVCTGAIGKREYRKTIRQLTLFFEGKKMQLMRELRREMQRVAEREAYEDAARLRNQLFALEHIQDVALITKADVSLPFSLSNEVSAIDLDGRIEAYDLSHISGSSAVGSLAVFFEGKPLKNQYRRFKIKSVEGANDVAMLEEVIRRRLHRAQISPHAWPLPELFLIDGGEGQVHRVRRVLAEARIEVPVVGIAKGFDRKQDRLVYDSHDLELARVAHRGKEVLQRARDEAHRFALAYHRTLRRKTSGIRRARKKSGMS